MSEIVKVLPYSIDLNETIKKTELHTLFVMGDSLAHRFELTITNGSKAVDLEGATVTGYFTNFKEKTTIEVDGKHENGKAIVTLSKPCYTLHGQFVLIVQVKIGDVEASIFEGEGFMRTKKAEKIVYEDFVIYDVDTLLAQIADMKKATTEAKEATQASKTQTEAAKKATNDADEAAKNADGWARATISVEKLAAGSNPTASVNTASDGHKVIVLGIPKGDTGATPQITFEVATGQPGTDVQIEVSGTAEAPHLLLTIPKGDTGAIENLTINGKPVESGTITLTAADLEALPSDGTAVNASKFNGKTWAQMLNTVYPVGSIYMSVNSTNPGTLFGGTWEQLEDRFLLGAGSSYSVGSTGGEETHELTVSEMPAHAGHLYGTAGNVTGKGNAIGAWLGSDNMTIVSTQTNAWGWDYKNNEYYPANRSLGGSAAHNNMPPYLAVYMWKRVN